jgi:hypothetical protein
MFYPWVYADCLLKNMSTKDNKYVVNQILEHEKKLARSFNFTFRYIYDIL